MVKRVVGMPGDTVELRDNRLFVNGKRRPLRAAPIREFPAAMAGTAAASAGSFATRDGRRAFPPGHGAPALAGRAGFRARRRSPTASTS